MANIPVRMIFETPVTMAITIGTGSAGIASGAGQSSTQVSVNNATAAAAGKNVQRYSVSVKITANSAPTAGGTYEFYLIRSDGTNVDGGFSTTDAGWSDGTLRDQLEFIGAIVVTNTGSKVYKKTFYVYNVGQNLQIGFWNGTSASVAVLGSAHSIIVTPETDTICA